MRRSSVTFDWGEIVTGYCIYEHLPALYTEVKVDVDVLLEHMRVITHTVKYHRSWNHANKRRNACVSNIRCA